LHLLITNIKWATDGADGVVSGLPKTVVALDAHDGADQDQDWIDDELSNELSDVFGFVHDGFTVEVLDLKPGGHFDCCLIEAPDAG
jgi:hypothetical protein